jgi:signal transduction histidine kinase/tetratricopeptide (TPR) repeat protein
MSRALLLALVLCFAGPVAATAHSVTPSAEPFLRGTDDANWKSFDDLVAGAKASMMSDPEATLQKARIASEFARQHFDDDRRSEALATGLWLEAEALTRMNRVKDARGAIDRAIKLAEADGKPTKLDGDLTLSLARIAESTGDVSLSLRSFHKAHDIFVSVRETRGQAMALQGLGSIYDQARDFEREIEYYRRASQVHPGDPALDLSAANNVGFALQQLGRYDEAVKDFKKALEIGVALKSAFLQARVLTNLAAVYAKMHRFDEADEAADRALRLLGRRDENGWAPFVWGVKAQLEFERQSLDDAAIYLDRAFRGVDLATTISPFRDMHEVAYKVYRAKGDYDVALEHLEAFKRLDDEGRSLSASANLALRGARFDFATQQVEIARLRTEQLKRDISLKESEAALQSLMFVGMLLSAIVLIVWISWRNISVRKHRNEIEQSNIALTKTVAERDAEIKRRTRTEAELRKAKEVAEKANHAKAQFLANMSHELRTPLNAIIGFSEVISTEMLGPVGTPNYKGYAGDIYASGQHLLAILNDILDMARIDAGKIELIESEFALADVVGGTLRVFGEEVRGGNKIIRFVPPNPPVTIRGDERLIRQVVMNLVSNAVKCTGDCGVIEIEILSVEDGVDVLVKDNGIGIPEDKLALVMEPFGQAGDAFTRGHGGVGLGLSIVKSLVELHGGAIVLMSKVNEGTVARVHLPASRIVHARSRALAS